MVNKNLLKSKLTLFELSPESTAERIGMNGRTFRRRLSGDTEFNCSEVTKLSKLLHLTNDEIMEIFFTDKVS